MEVEGGVDAGEFSADPEAVAKALSEAVRETFAPCSLVGGRLGSGTTGVVSTSGSGPAEARVTGSGSSSGRGAVGT